MKSSVEKIFLIFFLFIFWIAPVKAQTPTEDITDVLEQVRREYNLPGIAVAIVSADTVIASGVTGVRVVGKPHRITINDRFHIGSVTKPMTAMMIAVLVEKGSISWKTTPADVFPELKDKIHPSLRTITVEQLLAHRAGIQSFGEDEELEKIPKFTGSPTEIRRNFAEWLLQRGATSVVGEFRYSNGGYGLAAAMAERVAGQSWETLMRKLLFEPAGMNSAGFGWAARTHPNEPWGHQEKESTFVPHSPKDKYQLPPMIDPSGDVHLNILDLARFAQLHLGALNGQAKLLQASTFEKLHQPIGEYALGWNIQQIRGLPASMHFGSASTFFTSIMVYPKKDIAIVIGFNADSEKVRAAHTKLINLLLRRYKAL